MSIDCVNILNKIKLEVILIRSSHQGCSIKKGFIRNFTKFTGKHLCQSLIKTLIKTLNKNFIQKQTLAQVFPVNFAKFLRTSFLKNTSGRLLLFNVNKYSKSFSERK